jgi:superfamily II DNA or RNA helicase
MKTGTNTAIKSKLNLWPHQKDAIKIVEKYIRDYRDARTSKAALVQMPTGSGKSGVIAVLSRIIQGIGHVLVLTPRISLRDQLYRDIAGRFFRHVGYFTENLPKRVSCLEDGKLPDISPISNSTVIVTTIQKLVSMSQKNANEFASLAGLTSLLMVDEGHYEPAKEWSRVIRNILAPKIIFTATPYRNDFKVFDIDTNHSFTMSLCEAQEKRFVRSITFVRRNQADSPDEYARDVVTFYDTTFGNNQREEARVIIRCDDRAAIRQLAHALQKLGRTVVGIHEEFASRGGQPWEHKHVPDPETEKATFWIHQFKLLEGIDDPRFQVLAIYEEPIQNARSLVQQIGRIIRNPKRAPNAVGYVLEHWGGQHEQLWNGFLQYDKKVRESGIEALMLSTGEGLAAQLIKTQPKTAYVEGRFRSEFDFKALSPLEDFQLPLRVKLLRKGPSFTLQGLVGAMIDTYEERDRAFESYSPSVDSRVIVSVDCENSPYLRNHCFLECDLHVAVIREYQDYVGFFESSGATPKDWDECHVIGTADTKTLRRLFSSGGGSRITSVSLKNTNLGTSVIRSRTITAVSIASTVPGFDDHAQVCTTAEGYSDEIVGGKVRRYVGFGSGRVSQSSVGYVPLAEYMQWLDGIDSILQSAGSTIPALARYALEAPIPDDPQARSVLFDLEDIKEEYKTVDDKALIEFEGMCVPVEDQRFELKANSRNVTGTIQFIPASGRYLIKSPDIEALYRTSNRELPVNLVKYFNHTQAFRILPNTWTSIYVNGQFYKPMMRVGSKFDKNTYQLGRCLVPDPKIGNTTSEKGVSTRRKGIGWQADSLFGIIDSLGAGSAIESHFGNPDIMVCDDMGKEAADFILCDSSPKSPRVVFIHAKAAAERHECSASALHVVCAQAVKNLGYMAMFSNDKPNKTKNNGWCNKWRDPKIGSVTRRIRRGVQDTQRVWKTVQMTINNPLVEKEVWLFLGQVLSKRVFEEKISQTTPPAEALQAAYLLHATMSDVAAVGAKLKVFCGP